MPAEKRLVSLFEIFANRAVAEMRRLRLEDDLRERQEKLGRLIDSAMDAIVELDGDMRITLVNAAAEEVFGETADRLHGQGAERLLGASATRLAQYLGKALEPLSPADVIALKSYVWPGNARELRNVVERALITSTDGRLRLDDILRDARTSSL